MLLPGKYDGEGPTPEPNVDHSELCKSVLLGPNVQLFQIRKLSKSDLLPSTAQLVVERVFELISMFCIPPETEVCISLDCLPNFMIDQRTCRHYKNPKVFQAAIGGPVTPNGNIKSCVKEFSVSAYEWQRVRIGQDVLSVRPFFRLIKSELPYDGVREHIGFPSIWEE